MRLTMVRLVVATLAMVALVLPSTVPTVAGPAPGHATSPIVAEQITGGGTSFMRVAVTRHGNLWFESPKGVPLLRLDEGYALCRDEQGEVIAFAYDLPLEDVDPPDVGLGPVTVSQPTPGRFPVTILRKTIDGRIRLTQVWSVPDTTEKDVTVTMTVRNVSSVAIDGLWLMRSADSHSDYADDPNRSFFRAATTADSVFQWWDESMAGTDGVANGLVMTARTLGRTHEAGMSDDVDLALWCGGFAAMRPFDPGAGGSPQVVYELPRLAPKAEVTVAFTYRRL